MEPITERSNDLSADIDIGTSEGIVRILSQCDAEIFNGWKQHKSLYEVIPSIERIADNVVDVLKSDKGGVVLSGCGTSGRLAFVVSRTFNKIFGSNKFHYTIAGGDRALLLSTEAPEDSYQTGINDLEQISLSFDRVLFIGITCGLSAPYVAGQLDYCLNNLHKYTPVLLGFNTVEQARRVSINNWNKTFYDVASAMEKLGEPHCFIINPIVGPEPITGSSRMKSGSVTKIILETLFFVSFNKYHNIESSVEGILLCYEMLHRCTYLQSNNIAKLVHMGGESLSCGGRICYIGHGSQGIMAVIDASECPPTYGASFDDIRGFLLEGWDTLANNEGNLSHRGPLYQLDLSYFENEVLPKLTLQDTIIFVGFSLEELSTNKLHHKLIHNKSCKVGVISVTRSNIKSIRQDNTESMNVNIMLPVNAIDALASPVLPADTLISIMSELCVKWSLNAISTGAHIAKGKVLSNRMIDLQVSNSKLYYRSIGIIQEVTGVTRDVAERYLLSSIYENKEEGVADKNSDKVTSHIAMAAGKPLVVPTAILMIKNKLTCNEAKAWLNNQPILRKALI